MSELALSNVINISVSAAPVGLGKFNTSNLALFTHDVPGEDFGDDGYKIYKNPSEVTADFGSFSKTSQMAISVFSQKPNILQGGGYLVVIPCVDTSEIQNLAFSADPTTGSYKLNYGSEATALITANSTASQVQAALRLIPGLESVTVSGSEAASFNVTFAGVAGNASTLVVSDNTLNGGITITVTTPTPGVAETLGDAVTRTADLVQYFGVMQTEIMGSVELLAAAAVIQALNKIAFAGQKLASTVDSGGLIDLLRTGSFTQTRGLLYVGTALDIDALLFQAAYAGRGLSTAFSGSNTTQTMHLKDLIGIQPDAGMTQTILEKCRTAGADVYASIQGVPKTFTSGANDFFDQVYNLQWFVGALQVAGFNALAQSSTKLPQTEQGMSILKAAYVSVCQQGVANQYLAPGSWNSPDTFGVQQDFFRNIEEVGFYVYSSPISSQSAADRAAREAPLVQIAVKEAGAVHESTVIVNVNA